MRYLPLSDADRSAMLQTIGAATVDDLFSDVPPDLLLAGPIAELPAACIGALGRAPARRRSRGKNLSAGEAPFFLGCGAYKHHIPASVDHIIQRGEFLTAYTPYQPEIAQGTLQVLFEFQTQVARLYGCEVANASMYDGSTAMLGSDRHGRSGSRGGTRRSSRPGVHPHYVSVATTMAKFTERSPRNLACRS